MKCIIVLPCYNEEGNLQDLIREIDEVLGPYISYQIVAVNDGSPDSTKEILRGLSATYPVEEIDHENNMGLAAALRTGLDAAIRRASDEDFVIVMDADNTHDPKFILKMVEEAERGIDIVIASRYVNEGRQMKVPLHRIILSKAVNFLIRRIAEIPVRDATSGYRCYRASALRRTCAALGDDFVKSLGFEVSLEILVKTYWCNSSIKEVPTTLDYSKRVGNSSMKLVPTIKQYIRLLQEIKSWRDWMPRAQYSSSSTLQMKSQGHKQ